MPSRDSDTEKKIIDTAMTVFFTEGRLHATTQDIADAAGVSRTLLHYYFRSRNILFETVTQMALDQARKDLNTVLESPIDFCKKIETFIDVFQKRINHYPYLENFVITELNAHAVVKYDSPNKKKSSALFAQFLDEIEQQMNNGVLHKMKPIHFMFNLFALMVYPNLVKPLNMKFFNISETQYTKLMKERKKVIMGIIFI